MRVSFKRLSLCLISALLFLESAVSAQEVSLQIPALPAGETVTLLYQVSVNNSTPVETKTVRLQSTVTADMISIPPLPDVITTIEVLNFILESPSHFLWNTFLSMENVISLINKGSTPVGVSATVLNAEGGVLGAQNIAVLANSQQDVLVSLLPGIVANSFGSVRLEFTSNQLESYGMYYRFNPLGSNLEFSALSTIDNPLSSDSFVAYNTIQPSGDPLQRPNQVANWLQIANVSEDETVFIVTFFNLDGTPTGRQTTVIVPAGGRRDVEAGHVDPGPERAGLIRIEPQGTSPAYLAQLVRYGSSATNATLAKRFPFALMLPARQGDSGSQYVPYTTGAGGEAYLVLSNTESRVGVFTIDVFDGLSGYLTTLTAQLSAHAQTHLSLSGVLGPNRNGAVRIISQSGVRFVADATVYFREPNQRQITAAYATPARGLLPPIGVGSYNRFLEQANFITTYNLSGSGAVSSPSIFAITAGSALGVTPIPLADGTGVTIEASQLEGSPAVDTYGYLLFSGQDSETILSEVLRLRYSDEDASIVEAIESIPVR